MIDKKKETWMLQANCFGVDPELFFPGEGENDTSMEAKKVCSECVVAMECLEYALINSEKLGIWGGTGVRDRRKIRRQRRLEGARKN